MKRAVLLLALALASLACQAGGAGKDRTIMVYGKADGDVPGWTVMTDLPAGWTGDCCMYAKAIGVNLVLYRGEWTGKPERVMVLNVWPARLSSLEAEIQDDRHHYLGLDPGAKVDSLKVANKTMACRGVRYEGTDHEDDLVVFCDPGLATGVRFSWSMTLAHDDPQAAALAATFLQVVGQSLYLRYEDGTKGRHGKAAARS